MNAWFKNAFSQAAWAPVTVFIFYAVAAKVFNAYIAYPWLDIPTHFAGGLAISYFFLHAVFYSQPVVGAIPKLVQRLLVLGLTAITAVAWEFFEYACDVMLGTKMNLGVADTLADLFFGLLGAVVVISFAYRVKRFALAA